MRIRTDDLGVHLEFPPSAVGRLYLWEDVICSAIAGIAVVVLGVFLLCGR